MGNVNRIRRRAVAMRQPYKRVPNVTFVIFGRSKRNGDGVFTAAAGHPDVETWRAASLRYKSIPFPQNDLKK
ncbi:MAG: hypothetical protein K6C07_04260 [Bacteroidales bacterium]|nr:hypothetical protein [Bacteroidales bacterium]